MRKCKGVAGEIAVMEAAELSRASGLDDGETSRISPPEVDEENSSSSSPLENKINKKKRTRRTVGDGDSRSLGSGSSVELRRNTRRRVVISTTGELPVICEGLNSEEPNCSRQAICEGLNSEETNCSDSRPAIFKGLNLNSEETNCSDSRPAIFEGLNSEETSCSDSRSTLCCSSNEADEIVDHPQPVEADSTGEIADQVGTLTFSDSRSERTRWRRRRSRALEESGDELDDHEHSEMDEPKPMIQSIPSELEIEEFFASADEDVQKRFIDKYNFDIVKDVPLEGRYEWVPMKPT